MRLVLAALAALGTLLPVTSTPARAQTPAQQAAESAERLLREHDNLEHRLSVLEKLIDDVLWFDRVGDIAVVEKVRI